MLAVTFMWKPTGMVALMQDANNANKEIMQITFAAKYINRSC